MLPRWCYATSLLHSACTVIHQSGAVVVLGAASSTERGVYPDLHDSRSCRNNHEHVLNQLCRTVGTSQIFERISFEIARFSEFFWTAHRIELRLITPIHAIVLLFERLNNWVEDVQCADTCCHVFKGFLRAESRPDTRDCAKVNLSTERKRQASGTVVWRLSRQIRIDYVSSYFT